MLLAMRVLLAGAVAASLAVSSAALSSCTSDTGSPRDAADRLARSLTEGALDPALFAGEPPQAELDAIVDALGEREATRTVTVGGVAEEDGTAEAQLRWTWALRDDEWSYDTAATLEEVERGWQVTWSPALVEPSLVEGETLEVTTLLPARGEILGAGGRALVTSRPVVRFGIDKTRVGPRRVLDSARRVAALLDVDPASLARAVRAAGDRAFVEALVLRRSDARAVDPAYADIPGAAALEDEMPLAPTRDFAAPVLGRVGPATAELVEESPGRIRAGDEVGLSGLQLRYDEELTGVAGVEVVAVTSDGARRTLHTADPVDGEPLRTTLDQGLQRRAEEVLAATPGVAALVAVRPSTGALLAAANGPGNEGLNAATFGQYPPGSTFKVVTALALLRSGLTPDSPVACPAGTVVDGKRFENYDDYPAALLGRIPLRQAFAHSCNTAFITAGQRLGAQALARAAEALGLGVDFDLGFPAYLGQVPAPASDTEAAADLIGQGRVLASPLAMAAVAASVRAGRTVVPHLVDGFEPAAAPREPLTGAEAEALRGLMRAVVTEGSGSLLAGLPGDVGAKTGTAEFGDPRPDGSLATHAWMVATRGDLAVAAFVEDGASGSRTAGPLLEAFLR